MRHLKPTRLVYHRSFQKLSYKGSFSRHLLDLIGYEAITKHRETEGMQLSIVIDLVLGLLVFATFSLVNFITMGLFWSFMCFENYDQHLVRHCIEHPRVIPIYLFGWFTHMMIPASIVLGYGLVFQELSVFDIFIISLTPGLIVALWPRADRPRPMTSGSYQKVIDKIVFLTTVRWQVINFCFVITGSILGLGVTHLLS